MIKKNQDHLFQGMPAIWDKDHYLVWDADGGRVLTFKKLSDDSPELSPPTLNNKGQIGSSNALENNWLTAVLVLTKKCNLACSYCYAEANEGNGGRQEMNCEQVRDILNACLARGLDRLYVSFTGGEPTLNRESLKYAVSHMEKSEIPYSLHVSTNGTCPEEFQDWLIDKGFDFSVSMDGANLEDNAHRTGFDGKSVFNKVKRFIQRLVERGALFQIRSTLTAENLSRFPDALSQWANWGVRFVHYELVDDFGRARNRNLGPTHEQYLDLLPEIFASAQEKQIYLINSSFMRLLQPGAVFCTSMLGRRLHFNPDGSVSACYKVQKGGPEKPMFITGHMNCPHLEMDEKAVKALKSYAANRYMLCTSCFARMVCGGGCPIHHTTHAIEGQTVSDSCILRRGALHQAILHSYQCFQKGETSMLLGSAVYDALVESKFKHQEKRSIKRHGYDQRGIG